MFEAWSYSLPLEYIEKFNITPTLIGNELVKQISFYASCFVRKEEKR